MCFYIGIEDLAANALIEILTKKARKYVTYKELEEYGNTVIRILGSKNEKAVLILSRESTNEMFRSYSDYFEEIQVNSELGIALKDGVTVDSLIDKFRGYLAWDVLLALIDKKSLAVLGVAG